MAKSGASGASMGGMEVSPARAARYKKKLARENARWKAKCGPVTTRHVDPETLRKPS